MMFKFDISAIKSREFFLSLSASLLMLGCDGADPNHQAWSATRILILGDSLSASYGMQQNQGWVHLLANQEYDTVVKKTSILLNASIAGRDHSRSGLARFDRDCLTRHKPDVVLIELGGNDGLRGMPVKKCQTEFVTNYRKGPGRWRQTRPDANPHPPELRQTLYRHVRRHLSGHCRTGQNPTATLLRRTHHRQERDDAIRPHPPQHPSPAAYSGFYGESYFPLESAVRLDFQRT